jgi:hypothetical protein
MTRLHTLATLAAVALLAACGGGDDSSSPAAGGSNAGASGTLTLSASAPALHDGTVAVAAATVTNEARAADGAFNFAYCAVTFTDATHSNAAKYQVQVYFRQSDAKVINVNVADAGFGWVVGQSGLAPDITGVTVDAAARTITFTAKALDSFGDTTKAATVAGSLVFPKNASVAACGA